MFRFSAYPAFRFAWLVIAGIIVGKLVDPSVPLLLALTAVLFLVVLILSISAARSPRFEFVMTIALTLLCMAIGATKFAFDSQRSVVNESWLEQPVTVSGVISGVPTVLGTRTRFLLDVDDLVLDGERHSVSQTALVTLQLTAKDTTDRRVTYGNIITLHGTLSRPSAERNPGDFSARQYYEANGIPMMMFVKGVDQMAISDSAGGWWIMRTIVVPARQFMIDLIGRTIGGEEGEFLKGLLLGERSGISADVKQAFINSGVAHVLAVSGSNVAVVAAFIFFLLEFLRLPKRARVVATCFGLVFYMLLTGSQPPVVRATVMALVLLLAGLAQEKSNAYNSLGLAALIILGVDARQLYDVGFQLSFVAVLSIMYMYPKANAWINRIDGRTFLRRAVVWVLRVCAVSLVATLGTLPLTAIYFGKVSIIGILANIIVIPAVGLSVVLGFVSALAGVFSIWLAEVYAAVNLAVLSGTLLVAKVAGGLSFAFIDTLRFTAVDAIPFYVALAILLHLGNPVAVRRFIIPLLVALNIAVFVPPPAAHAATSDRMRISVIDVGQGDAILVEFPDGTTMLVDAGPKALQFDAGERIVVPFLKRRNISTIDLLVVSHPHSDHIGGVPAILESFDVKRVIDSGQPIRSQIYSHYLTDVANEECEFGSTIAGTRIDAPANARLYVLSPMSHFVDADTTHKHPNLNNTSVVLKMQYGNISLLLVGDAEKEVERDMVTVYGDFLRSTMLKVGHHGSNTSSTEDFLNAVKPEIALISVGRNNKFRHPSPAVLQRLEQLPATISRTDEDGALIFETDGNTITRIEWR